MSLDTRSVMSARLVLVLIAVCALCRPGAAQAAPPSGSNGVQIQLLDAPLAAQNDPRAHTYIVDQIRPGGSITRHIRVTNTSSSAAPISIYTAAATVTGGRYRFADDRTGNDVSSWTHLSSSGLDLHPNQYFDLTVSIAVPANTVGGERYAVIWAQRSSSITTAGAREVSRVGVRVYLDVDSDVTEKVPDFAIGGLSALRIAGGQPKLSAAVSNTGARTIDVSGSMTLSNGPGGVSVGPVPITTPITLAPGDAQNVSVLFDRQIPAGPWRAKVDLTSGMVHRSTVGTILFAATVPTTAPATDHPQSSTGSMIWIGFAIVLAALSILIWVTVRRRSHHAITS